MAEEATDKGTGPSHTPGARKGEELAESKGVEEGRLKDETSAGERPGGKASARMSTGVNPEMEEPIDPAMPNLPPA